MLLLQGHRSRTAITGLAFSPDGLWLASAAADTTVRLWDLTQGTGEVVESSPSGYGRSVGFSPDGRWLAWTGKEGVTLLDRATGGRQQVDVAGDRCSLLAFSPDGRTLVVAGGSIHLVDVPTWARRSILDEGILGSTSVACSPDGSCLAVACIKPGPSQSTARYFIRLYDPTGGVIHGDITTPTQVVNTLSFSPDGSLLAGTYGASWTVWESATGDIVMGHKIMHRSFFASAFTPDGRHLAVSYSDRSVRFCDTQTWEERRAYRWKIGRVVRLAMAPDGMKAAGGGDQGTIVVWDLDD